MNISPKTFNIHPRTSIIAAEVRLSIHGTPEVKRALYLVNYVRQTARCTGTAEMNMRKISGYRFAQLVLESIGKDGVEVAQHINRKFAASHAS